MVLNACISGSIKEWRRKKKCFDSCLHTLMSSSGSVELWKKIKITLSDTAPWAWHSSVSTFSSSSPLKMMNWFVKHADPTDFRTRLASRSQHPRPGQSHVYFGCHCEIPIEEAKSVNLMFTTFNHLQIVPSWFEFIRDLWRFDGTFCERLWDLCKALSRLFSLYH